MVDSKRDVYVLVFDCGSINIRAVAVNPLGEVVAYSSRPNKSIPQPNGKPGWLIWDFEEIWHKICEVSREVSGTIGPENIRAVSVITWGADGAPIKRNGELTYPPISWQCPRTREVAEKITEHVSAWEIFRITGYQIISFNTLFKLIWLRKEASKALEEAETWLMMPGLIANRLTGEFHIDPTIASTMMAMDLGRRDWSAMMLELADLTPGFFPEWREPGEIVGYITEHAAHLCGLLPGTPVVAGGHDTQFAIFGSGAGVGDVVLSSGTWEILGVRVNFYSPSKRAFEEGMIIEADVERGLWNPQFLMIASAVIEWIINSMFRDVGERRYERIIEEIKSVPPGSNGLIFIPSFVGESGPLRKYGVPGIILGLNLNSTRAHILHAVFEGLTFQMREALKILAESMNIRVNELRVVGGGSKNDLWNQMRADATGMRIIVPAVREAATLGAALTSFVGIGYYRSIDEARKNLFMEERVFNSVEERKSAYDSIFKRYIDVLKSLKEIYKS